MEFVEQISKNARNFFEIKASFFNFSAIEITEASFSDPTVPLKSVKISGPDVSLSRELVSSLHNSHNAEFLKEYNEEFTLVIREHEAAYVDCIVISAYPPPEILLLVANHSVNNFFKRKISVSTSGPLGLRLIKWVAVL